MPREPALCQLYRRTFVPYDKIMVCVLRTVGAYAVKLRIDSSRRQKTLSRHFCFSKEI